MVFSTMSVDWKMFTLLFSFMVVNVASLRVPGSTLNDAEEVTISVDTPLTVNRKRRAADSLPSHLNINLDSGAVQTSLSLDRNYDIDVNVPITVERVVDGRKIIVQESIGNIETTGFYQNTENGSVFVVELTDDEDEDDKLEFLGTFFVGSQEYRVQPSDGAVRKHVIQKIKEDIAGYGDGIEIKGEKHWTGKTDGGPRHKRNTEYYIEILFVVDYTVYSFWYDKSSKVTASEKDKEAKQLIRQFYAFILNGIDLRYKSVQGFGYTITTVYAGIHIADTVGGSTWTESNKNTSFTPTRVNIYAALDDFRIWKNNQTGLPDHDHAMLFTKYDFEADGSTSVQGLASLSALCTDWSQSVNEDNFDAGVNTIAGHELGHSLGASHDGTVDGIGNSCPAEAGNVMTAISSLSNTDLTKNQQQWIFSSCSLTYIDNYITQMNSDNVNCMTSFGSSYNATALSEYDGVLAGQVYGPDTQCQNIEGDGSYLCRSFYDGDYSSLCSRFYCDNGNQECSINIAWEGTSCGNGKICSSGVCVTSANAPELSDTCPFGDQPETVGNTGLTCSTLAQSTPHNCYFYNEDCCISCPAIETGNPDCLYGDRSASCSTLDTWDCYTGTNNDICCALCSQAYTGIAGCEYGDKADWCATLSTRDCYLNDAVCCATCAAADTGIDGCKYGDRADWCATLEPPGCYWSAETCCSTCLHTGITGCEYGDNISNCDVGGCSDASYAADCCGTCQTTTTSTTTSTTTAPSTTTSNTTAPTTTTTSTTSPPTTTTSTTAAPTTTTSTTTTPTTTTSTTSPPTTTTSTTAAPTTTTSTTAAPTTTTSTTSAPSTTTSTTTSPTTTTSHTTSPTTTTSTTTSPTTTTSTTTAPTTTTSTTTAPSTTTSTTTSPSTTTSTTAAPSTTTSTTAAPTTTTSTTTTPTTTTATTTAPTTTTSTTTAPSTTTSTTTSPSTTISTTTTPSTTTFTTAAPSTTTSTTAAPTTTTSTNTTPTTTTSTTSAPSTTTSTTTSPTTTISTTAAPATTTTTSTTSAPTTTTSTTSAPTTTTSTSTAPTTTASTTTAPTTTTSTTAAMTTTTASSTTTPSTTTTASTTATPIPTTTAPTTTTSTTTAETTTATTSTSTDPTSTTASTTSTTGAPTTSSTISTITTTGTSTATSPQGTTPTSHTTPTTAPPATTPSTSTVTTQSVTPTSTPATTTNTSLETESANMVTVLDYTPPANTDLNDTETYKRYEEDCRRELTIRIRRFVPRAVIVIRRLRWGSLIVDYTVTYPADDSSKSDLVQASVELAQADNFSIQGQQVQVTSLQIQQADNVSFTVTTATCELFDSLTSGCADEFECTIVNSKPTCQKRSSAHYLSLLLALGIGIPAVFFVIVIFTTLTIHIIRTKRKRGSKSSLTDDHSYSKREAFPAMVPYSSDISGKPYHYGAHYQPQLRHSRDSRTSHKSSKKRSQRSGRHSHSSREVYGVVNPMWHHAYDNTYLEK